MPGDGGQGGAESGQQAGRAQAAQDQAGGQGGSEANQDGQAELQQQDQTQGAGGEAAEQAGAQGEQQTPGEDATAAGESPGSSSEGAERQPPSGSEGSAGAPDDAQASAARGEGNPTESSSGDGADSGGGQPGEAVSSSAGRAGGGSTGETVPGASADTPSAEPLAGEPAQPPASPDVSAPDVLPPGELRAVMDALEQSLRRGEVNENMLDDLGWDLPRTRQFVEAYKRLELHGQEQMEYTAVPEGPQAHFPDREADEQVARGEPGAATAGANLNATHQRSAAGRQDVMSIGRQRVTPRYQPWLEAYYRSLATQPAGL
jgi:hypothetical protein